MTPEQRIEALRLAQLLHDNNYDDGATCTVASATRYEAATLLRTLADERHSRWCPVHQHYKPCEHNGGVEGTRGWEFPVEPQGEPVAWMAESGEVTRNPMLADSWRKHGGNIEPLYSAPARTPLTEVDES
jgi:hypothetical protein